MGKKKRKSKKKSKSPTVDHHPEEANNGTSPCPAVAPPGPGDSSVTMASMREYIHMNKEHVQHMRSEGDEPSDDAIKELTNALGSAVTLKSGSNSFLTSLLDTATLGKSPRSSFDKNMVMDLHAWCVDEEGNVCDYPDDQNQHGDHATGNIVRRPWDAYMVAEALPHIDKLCQEKFFGLYPDTSSEQWIQMIHSNTFPKHNCTARAKILRDSQPEKYALVIGSLGYKQPNGTIFWEFG